MKSIWILILLATLSNHLIAQRIEVEFVKEGRKIELKDDFNIYFVFGDSISKTIVRPEIYNNSFKPPCIESKDFNILLKYKNRVYTHTLVNLSCECDMRLTFGYDRKPIRDEYLRDDLPTYKINHNYVAVGYLRFQYLEGEYIGVQSASRIKSKRKYFKWTKQLLYDPKWYTRTRVTYSEW